MQYQIIFSNVKPDYVLKTVFNACCTVASSTVEDFLNLKISHSSQARWRHR